MSQNVDNTSRGLLAVAAILFAVLVLFSIGGLAVIYWADEVASPSWDESSVPPPKTY